MIPLAQIEDVFSEGSHQVQHSVELSTLIIKVSNRFITLNTG